MGVDAFDAGFAADPADHARHPVAFQEHPVGGDEPVGMVVVVGPGVEEFDQAGVQRDVAVVAQFADRDPQPPRP